VTASRSTYAEQAIGEIALADRVLSGPRPAVNTVFVGGGTPTLLSPEDLGRIVAEIRARFGLLPDAELTTEANPETVDPAYLVRLREAGFTRISFSRQTTREHVLKSLQPRHPPVRPAQCVQWARRAWFEHINLDLIYGTPGESDQDWTASLEAAIAAGPDHVSAYSLIVEQGTRLAARVRRGELAEPDEDTMADR